MGCGRLTACENGDLILFARSDECHFMLSEFKTKLNSVSCEDVVFTSQKDLLCEFKTLDKQCVFTLKYDCSVSSDISKKYLIVTPEFVWINPNTPMAFDVESNVDWFIE